MADQLQIIKRIMKRELKELKQIKRNFKARKVNVKTENFARLHQEILERESALHLLKKGELVYVHLEGDRYMVGRKIDDETLQEATDRIKRLSIQTETTDGDSEPAEVHEPLREDGESPVRVEDGSSQESSDDSFGDSDEFDPEVRLQFVGHDQHGDENGGGVGVREERPVEHPESGVQRDLEPERASVPTDHVSVPDPAL